MAAMDQTKLNNMASAINSCAEEYETTLLNENGKLLEAFNTYWVSNSAQGLANEIKTCLESVEDAITNTFSNKNDDIASAVSNFNMVENENIIYKGFSFGKPTINLELNDFLPGDGEKKGVADGANLENISDPIKSLATNIQTILETIKNTVSKADAFSSEEQAALTSSITTIKTKFEEEMTELVESVSTRMSGEMTERTKLDSANINNLSNGG